MKLKINLFLSLSVLLMLAAGFEANAQMRRQNSRYRQTSDLAIDQAKWMMGIKGSMSFTHISPTKRYEVLTPYYVENIRDSAKLYNPMMDNKGYSFALTLSYSPVPMLGLVMEPSYSNYIYSYKNKLGWMLDDGGSYLTYDYMHKQEVSFFDLPLLLRFNPMQTRFKAFAQAGAFYGFRLNAQKKTNWTETRFYAENQNSQTLQERAFQTSINDQFKKSHYGIIFGGGLSYDIQNWRISLQGNYKYGLTQLTNESGRYAQEELASAHYDVPDNFEWKQLEISSSISIPLDNLVQTNDTKPKKRR